MKAKGQPGTQAWEFCLHPTMNTNVTAQLVRCGQNANPLLHPTAALKMYGTEKGACRKLPLAPGESLAGCRGCHCCS